jgi:hypothetical protein
MDKKLIYKKPTLKKERKVLPKWKELELARMEYRKDSYERYLKSLQDKNDT